MIQYSALSADGRFVINVWRNIQPQPVLATTALCGGLTVDPKDLVVFEIRPDRVGENYCSIQLQAKVLQLSRDDPR